MGGENEKEQGGFRITDRRSFTKEGEIRQEANPEGQKMRTSRESESSQGEVSGTHDSASSPPPTDRAAIGFSSFLFSLATTAMVHLGEIPDPEGGKSREDLDAAKQMIDILTMLKEKTEGNRATEETRLLEELLYELRMKFVAKSKASQL
ncbi:MAG: DUF1844 domain-containing protein [Acidobacteriota bacterium]